jgi:A/G-specific adenine glycosylase
MTLDARPLVAWFRRTARDLPWRRTKDPYAVWVSEIMLQQTQIETVIPYYERWMKRWPTREALAKASMDDVLKAWEGLGYYARARNLHRAAREMASLPSTAAGWREVRGVGEYTAAAIASIAFGERAAALDGNVRRVMSRILADDDEGAIRAALEGAIPRGAPGDFNQALMELGQRVCRPRSPDCLLCPVSESCRARKLGRQEEFPRQAPSREVPHYEIAIGVCRKGGRVLVARRKAEGLLGGLWEFPGGKRRAGESYARALAREFREEVGLAIDVGGEFMVVPHRYSHFSVELHVFECRWRSGTARPLASDEVRWVGLDELEKLAFPKANRRIIARLLCSSRSATTTTRSRSRSSTTR